ETLAHLFLRPGGVLELPISQEISHIKCRVGQARAVEIHHCEPVRSNPDVFGFEVPVCERPGLLGEPLVQFTRAVEYGRNRRPHRVLPASLPPPAPPGRRGLRLRDERRAPLLCQCKVWRIPLPQSPDLSDRSAARAVYLVDILLT